MTNLPFVMLDLETLGTGDNACIVQIGAVRFDPFPGDEHPDGLISTPSGEFRQCVTPDNGEIDGPTVMWWMSQSEDARRRVFHDHGVVSLDEALRAFSTWVHSQGKVREVWCDLTFDWRILEQAYRRLGGGFPFKYGKGRDHRTIRQLGRSLGVPEPEFVGVRHDALDDAHHQALYVNNVLRFIDRSVAP